MKNQQQDRFDMTPYLPNEKQKAILKAGKAIIFSHRRRIIIHQTSIKRDIPKAYIFDEGEWEI